MNDNLKENGSEDTAVTPENSNSQELPQESDKPQEPALQQEEPLAAQSMQQDDFDYILGDSFFVDENLEESIDEKMTHTSKNKKKRKSKGTLKIIFWITSICVISVSLAFCLILFMSEYLGIGINKGNNCVVDIKKGMSTKQIAVELKEAGAINSEIMFRIYSKLSGSDGTYKYGVYSFVNEFGYKELAEMMQTEGEAASSVKVTIPEMASMDDIMKILEEKGVCTQADFRDAVKNGVYKFDFVDQIPTDVVYYKFEGYLFPDTYEFYNYDSKQCAELAIRKMLSNMNDKLMPEYYKKAQEMGKTMHEILTMASIVEMEASSSPNEMANVAAVFYNRLKWDEPHLLGSSPTAEYPHGNGRYNTNITPELPPGPLCAPSLNAIQAALSPTANFKATYFVTDSDMKFYYNETLAAHSQTISTLKAKGKWLG